MMQETDYRLPSGIPCLGDYLALLKTPLFSRMETFSNRFLNVNRSALKYYSRRWCSDPLHHWSRQWEYPYVFLALMAFAREHLSSQCRMLDAGSGATFFPFLAAATFPGTHVTCCDEDQKLTGVFEKLQHTPRNPVRFDAVGLQELSYADESLDVIYSISVLEHTESYETILREFQRTLRPGGLLILTFDIVLDRDEAIDTNRAEHLLALIGTHFMETEKRTPAGLSQVLANNDILTTQRVNRLNRTRGFWNYTLARCIRTLLSGRLPVRPGKHKSSILTVYCGQWRKAPLTNSRAQPEANREKE